MYRRAFTLLEMTFVIAILGIVASIGAQIIAKVYDQYIIQRAYYKAAAKTELAANQLANRLRYAIPRTMLRIDRLDRTEPFASALTQPGDNYKGIQWIGYDREGFEYTGTGATNLRPAWSGFCDLGASSANNLVTPGSNLARLQTIAANLNDGANIPQFRIFFATETDPNNAAQVNNVNVAANTLQLQALAPGVRRRMSEQYKLAWSSFAAVVENDGHLYLYTHLPPVYNTPYNNNGIRNLLLRNVTVFKFTGSENAVRFKICAKEPIGNNLFVTACKEKVVF
jgi:prepilin-type N-terminal cleavage/methylation domain-containing protein